MTFRERDQEAETNHGVPTTLATEETAEPTPPTEDEAETPEPVPEEAFTPLPARGEDPVRLYLKEIGKVPLLTARQEVEIGRRIEVGQIALRRLLAAIPMALRALLDFGDRLRHEQIAADDVIVLPEGGELDAGEIKRVLAAFARIRRLEREIDRLHQSLRDKRRSATTRANYAKWIAANREAIQKVIADMPLKPALIDDLVARIRRQCERIEQLGSEARRGKSQVVAREVRHLEREVGLPRRLRGQALPGKRPEPARPDPGGQHRADEGGGSLPVPPRLQVLHVRHVVDPPGDHARHRRPLADDSDPRAHGRDAEPDLSGEQGDGQRAWPRAHSGGTGPADRRAGQEGPAHPRVVAQAALAGDANRRGLGARRFPRGQVGGVAKRYAVEPGPLHPGGAGAGHAASEGEGDPSPPVRHRRGRRAHAGGGRQALRRDARAHSPDRGQGVAQASPPVARKEPQGLRRKLGTWGPDMAPPRGRDGPRVPPGPVERLGSGGHVGAPSLNRHHAVLLPGPRDRDR